MSYNQLSQEEWARKEFEKVREMRWQNACKLAGRIVPTNSVGAIDVEETMLKDEAKMWFRILNKPPWSSPKFESPPSFVGKDPINEFVQETANSLILETVKSFTMDSEWEAQLDKFYAEAWFGAKELEFYNGQWKVFKASPAGGF